MSLPTISQRSKRQGATPAQRMQMQQAQQQERLQQARPAGRCGKSPWGSPFIELLGKLSITSSTNELTIDDGECKVNDPQMAELFTQ